MASWKHHTFPAFWRATISSSLKKKQIVLSDSRLSGHLASRNKSHFRGFDSFQRIFIYRPPLSGPTNTSSVGKSWLDGWEYGETFQTGQVDTNAMCIQLTHLLFRLLVWGWLALLPSAWPGVSVWDKLLIERGINGRLAQDSGHMGHLDRLDWGRLVLLLFQAINTRMS